MRPETLIAGRLRGTSIRARLMQAHEQRPPPARRGATLFRKEDHHGREA